MSMHESLEERQARLQSGPHARAIDEFLVRLANEAQLDDDASYALAMLLVDATLDADEVSLHRLTRRLQVLYRAIARAESNDRVDEGRGRVLAFLDVAAWSLERALSLEALVALEGNATATNFMKAVMEQPGLSNGEIARSIDLSEAEASRMGRRLADVGLVAKRRIGRRNNWEVTPKGLQAIQLLEGGASRFRRPNLQRI